MITRKFEETVLPITEFLDNVVMVIDNLKSAKILTSRDKAKAVLVPYEQYKTMELIIEALSDSQLLELANERLNDSATEFISEGEFWKSLEE